MIEICPKCQSRNIRFIKNSIDEKICDDCCHYGRMIFRSELRDTIAENWFTPTLHTLGYQPATIPQLQQAAPLGRSDSMPHSIIQGKSEQMLEFAREHNIPVVTLGMMKRTSNRVVRDNVKKNSIVIEIKRRF